MTFATMARRGVPWNAPTKTIILMVFFAILVIPAYAQDSAGKPVTADDVNAVAKRLYCPVCENQPLDTCGTAACEQWRGEIKTQLEQGKTPQQVIDDFVMRYGERVVGVPEDPTLNALSLVTPWIISALVLAGAGYVLIRYWRSRQRLQPVAASARTSTATDDEYRTRLEGDLRARR